MRPAAADFGRADDGYLPLGPQPEMEWTTESSENTERERTKLILEQETHQILGACFIAPSSALGRPS